MMSGEGTSTPFSTHLPKASCIAALLAIASLLPLLGFGEVYGPVGFFLSLSLAVIAFCLGIAGLFVARPFAYSIVGLLLSGGVFLFWSLVVLYIILIAMTSLP